MTFIEKYLGKDAIDISKYDLEKFVKKKIEENVTLDYKDIDILGDPKKLLKHICGFANAKGGLIVVGVSESAVKGANNTVKVYPDKITWGDGKFTKEKLEDTIRGNIEPEPSMKIVPVRKSKSSSQVIFLIDVLHKGLIHLYGEDVYLRKDFNTSPLSTKELIEFVKLHETLQKCATFRRELQSGLLHFIHETLYRLDPSTREKWADPEEDETRKAMLLRFKQFMSQRPERMITACSKVPLRDFSKFESAFDDFERDVLSAEIYSFSELSAEERDLLVELKKEIERAQRGEDRSYFDIYDYLDYWEEGKSRLINNKWDYLGEAIRRSEDPKEIRNSLRRMFRVLRDLGMAAYKMQMKLEEIRDNFGSLAIKSYWDDE